MSTRLFDHIDLRVKNRQRAQQFYAQVLPALGFRVDKSGAEWGLFEAKGGEGGRLFWVHGSGGSSAKGKAHRVWGGRRNLVEIEIDDSTNE